MRVLLNSAKAAVAALAAFWIGLHVMIQLLVYAIGFDILTGMVAGWIDRSLDSAISRRGVARKVMVLIGVAASEVAGRHLGLQVPVPWGGTWGLGAAVAAYYCIHEGLSIVENLARAGVPLPEWVLVRLRQLGGAAERGSDV